MIRWRTNIEYEAGQYPWIALLDVFFILLVFFLISNSVVFWPGTKLETALSLPTASSAKLQEADKLIVTITRSGQIFFNEKELDWHGLEQELDGRVLESVQAFSNRHHLEDDPDGEKKRREMSEDLLKRARFLVVCGKKINDEVREDISIAKLSKVIPTTLEGVLECGD